MKFLLVFLLACIGAAQGPADGFAASIQAIEKALDAKDAEKARALIDRALERDPRSAKVWELRARCAELAGDQDERVYALHRELRLAVAQKAPREEIDARRARLVALDPIAADLLDLSKTFVKKLEAVALQYEKDLRPHSAIRVHKQMLALDPELSSSRASIERLAAARDPSLAEDAKPKDLLEGVSNEWIREHDAKHGEWDDRAVLEKPNYVTHTNAGYECLVRAAEAMEQMNAFYREFFYGPIEGAKKTVPRIDLHIFKSRDEYLKRGIGPPVEWSGGHFTGGAVETYVGQGGFQEMTGTLFHEAAHQFVSLATNAAGWLNEGLASFFEGCRMLPNGTVLMNEPADHYLFDLVARLQAGWMSNSRDGIDPEKPEVRPKTAPTFRLVLENEYDWGPPWYAPTWGVVFFLYNYQDPVDGRFVYRGSFRQYVDASGGKMGEGAIETFEKVVLLKPRPPIKGFKRPDGAADVALPKTVDELTEVWKDWLIRLADERSGKLEVHRPWLDWARAALLEKDVANAKEHFEKGYVESPSDPALLAEFATFLAEQKNVDRACKLMLAALRALESAPEPDLAQIKACDAKLDKWDTKRQTLERVRDELVAASKAIVARYESAELPSMVMDVAWRMASDHTIPELYASYENALRASKKSLHLWELAYNERDLTGWAAMGEHAFEAKGVELHAKLGEFAADRYDYQVLTLDRVTGGDFSLEAEVDARRGQVNFCGLVFGRKGTNNFHALVLFPGLDKGGKTANTGFVDLATSFGAGPMKTWRHSPVDTIAASKTSSTGQWHKLRIDVAGSLVDAWFDGEYVATQDFLSREVLRGSFGLVMGPGEARFRNVRFLGRDARDPAGEIERRVRMGALLESGGPVAGSFLGQVPPFPKVKRWVQGERKDWSDGGAAPQLLVFTSSDQNDLVPIDEWLRDLEARTRDVDLQIVSVVSAVDGEDRGKDYVETYLKAHPLPGAVAVDARSTPGIGDTFSTYSIARFNLPRLILLDVDRKVVWEGDPGFTTAHSYSAGDETFLDTPLRELVERRKLRELCAWKSEWKQVASALHEGEFELAAKALTAVRSFDADIGAEVGDARKKLTALDGALASLDATAASFARDGVDPALPVLIRWAELAGKPADKKALAALKPYLESKAVKGWNDLPKAIEAYRKKQKKAPDPANLQELFAKLEAAPGRFVSEALAELRAAGADPTAFDPIVESLAKRPALWLARDYFHW